MGYINTEKYSRHLRSRSVLLAERRVLVARLSGSKQEHDLTVPPNCGGYGRIRHFRLYPSPGWSPDPLPILPAAKRLGYVPDSVLRTQVFQLAACNWRCWYCFVDSDRLAANPRTAEFMTCDELLDLYLQEDSPPRVIDLSGGHPDLVPEWVLWFMETLTERGLSESIFLWSDDNLSGQFYWEHLNGKQRQLMSEYRCYSRVACFKGYSPESFSFNTHATPDLFQQQLTVYRRLLEEGLDLYGYVTFTGPSDCELEGHMRRFVDSLQEIHPNLPLRTVPLKISSFTPSIDRQSKEHRAALEFQVEVHAAWLNELALRFRSEERAVPICDVEMSAAGSGRAIL